MEISTEAGNLVFPKAFENLYRWNGGVVNRLWSNIHKKKKLSKITSSKNLINDPFLDLFIVNTDEKKILDLIFFHRYIIMFFLFDTLRGYFFFSSSINIYVSKK